VPAIARDQPSDGTNPVLELFTPTSGVLADAATVAFQVFDLSDDTKRASPVQVFPDSAGTRATVNVTDLWPTGDKLGPGHVVARWTPRADEPLGLHELRWFVQMAPSAAEQIVTVEFDVLAAGAGSYRSGYALVSDLRAEGVTEADATDVRLARLLRLASQYVDRMTGRFFEPRALTLAVDGSGGRAQLLGHPIICVREVKLIVALAAELGELPVTPSSFRVYNRHLIQGLTDPDDRENPRLEFFHESDLLGVQATPAASLGLGSLVWTRGAQNVVIDGLFGYTDPDGSAIGRTPELIRHVTKLLALREIPTLTDAARREDRQKRWRLVSERTRDQGYNLEPLRAQGVFTGDPEIDAILVAYQRPPQLGAA
jgi:hypothetical protein